MVIFVGPPRTSPINARTLLFFGEWEPFGGEIFLIFVSRRSPKYFCGSSGWGKTANKWKVQNYAIHR